MAIMKTWPAAAALLIAAVAVAGPNLPTAKKETKHLTVTTAASPEAAGPGKRVSLTVDVAPKPKMHVYAPGQEGYIGITLTLDADPAFTPSKPKYPAGEKLFIPVLKETQLVYAKPFRIAQDVTLRPRSGTAADGAALTIKGTLRYQACDDTICYLPVNVPVAWTITLASQ
jgi:cytochrome c biogenesis DsbD-like protein